MVKSTIRSTSSQNTFTKRVIIGRPFTSLFLLFCIFGLTVGICPFDCGQQGCCYARKDDIVCKTYKQSNIFNVSTILFTQDNLKAAALTFCDTYLCFLSSADSDNACVLASDDLTRRIDLPSGATGLLREGHTHFIDYPRELYIFKHHTTNTRKNPLNRSIEAPYSLLKISEDISFGSTINNYRVYEDKLCKFVNYEIRCTDGKIVEAEDACPEVFQRGDTSLAYVLVVLTILLVILTICVAIKFSKSPYEALDKTSQADAKDIKLEIEFSDVDLATTAEDD